MTAFDGGIDCQKMFKTLAEDWKAMQNIIRAEWVETATKLGMAVDAICPSGWELHSNDLLQKPDVLGSLFNNPSYGKIGPAVETLKQMVIAWSNLKSDRRGNFIPVELVMRTKKVISHGMLTVTTTYACYKIVRQLQMMKNATVRKQQIDILRQECADKLGVKKLELEKHPSLSKSILEKLKSMDSDAFVPTDS